jgi:cytochrome c oxidase assembly factor CtaG
MPALTAPLAGPAWLAHGGGAAEGLANVGFVVLLAALAAAYGRGVHELWDRRGTGEIVPVWRVIAFGAGVAALVTAQSPPVHAMTERSFAGHMAQHMILMVVAGPLLAAGAAGLPLTLAAPIPLRRRLARWRASPAGRSLRRPAILAVAAATAQTAVLWAWHLPTLYLLALDNPGVHAAEHLSFVAAAWLLWSAVLGTGPHRLTSPAAFLLLFATMMPATALAAVLTFAPAPLYPPPALAPTGGDPLTDQQLAGLVMWIPMDVVVLVAGTGLFLLWLSRLDRVAPGGRHLQPTDRSAAPAEEVTP